MDVSQWMVTGSALLTVLAPGLGVIVKIVTQRRLKAGEQQFLANVACPAAEEAAQAPPPNPEEVSEAASRAVLKGFAVVVLLFGGFAVDHYWSLIAANIDTLFFAGGLFLAMVAGMFVQVLAGNYRSGRPLFRVPLDKLLFPLLFSIVVFYPIWALAASSTRSLFSFYAAFLNGYFWESIVSAAKAPAPKDGE